MNNSDLIFVPTRINRRLNSGTHLAPAFVYDVYCKGCGTRLCTVPNDPEMIKGHSVTECLQAINNKPLPPSDAVFYGR